ncbi:MAG TPA: DUF6281 family protein [Nocardioidaceae bacterium]|nr:DUF6281 family protein [Nocardioidaceae bacterium]
MATQRTVLVIPGSGGCWHVPPQLFAVDAARFRGAQMHYVSWSGEVPSDPKARGPWAVEQIAAALRDLPEPLIIASSLGTLASELAADHGLPAVWITPLLHRSEVVEGMRRGSAPCLLIGGRPTAAGAKDWLANSRRMCSKSRVPITVFACQDPWPGRRQCWARWLRPWRTFSARWFGQLLKPGSLRFSHDGGDSPGQYCHPEAADFSGLADARTLGCRHDSRSGDGAVNGITGRCDLVTDQAFTGRRQNTEQMKRARLGVAALLAMPVLGGCIDIDNLKSDADDDCFVRIRYEGVLYRSNGDLNEAAPKGGELGTGDVVDCGDVDSAPKVGEVAVLSVKGVPTSVAVIVGSGEWRGIYVAEGVAQAEWPRVLHTR